MPLATRLSTISSPTVPIGPRVLRCVMAGLSRPSRLSKQGSNWKCRGSGNRDRRNKSGDDDVGVGACWPSERYGVKKVGESPPPVRLPAPDKSGYHAAQPA